MASIIKSKELDADTKVRFMNEDAKFEIDNDRDVEDIALRSAAEIRAKAAAPKVPKLFLASECIFNCAYCGCRCGREDRRSYCNSPTELARIAVRTAKENGYGIFISSAIYKNADYTQELMAESVRIIRDELGYQGYLHAKVMPGADPDLIARTGRYADRLSVNIEVAQSSGYQRIAKQKNKRNILTPMQSIADQIYVSKYERRPFARSQTTQLMAGSTDEDDRVIMKLSEALYRKYHLRRVYYTPFHYLHEAKGYEQEALPFKDTPRWRMARLYQADRLIQLYGFTPDDVTPAEDPFLHRDLDPKAAWALRHMELYPVEVNKADFDTLLRVPGIGLTAAKKMIEARRYCTLTQDILKKMRIPLNRSRFFITCNGKYSGGFMLDSPDIRQILGTGQLSFFDL